VSNREIAELVFQITLHFMEFGNCLPSIENVVEKAQLRFDEILTETTQIQFFGGTYNQALTFEHESYR
jgi:hypothetical protein